ncbi:MAG: hypothetical protein ACI9Y1_001425 [Lentisphaeria bacterium]|jgi:uncharacterized protein YjfI (DUF2170 family)
MSEKTSAHYQREYRRRLRDQGLVKKEVWVLPENAKHLGKFEKMLREPLNPSDLTKGVLKMTEMKRWTTTTLFEVLAVEPLFDGDRAMVELIDGAEPSLHLVMHEFGDLPLFLTVAGDQIIIDAVLWPKSEVADISGFNDAVLRTHKYFPLSTISLDTLSSGADYYQMFGALSASSILPNIIFEIEMLASNVIQATEAYANFLSNQLNVKV